MLMMTNRAAAADLFHFYQLFFLSPSHVRLCTVFIKIGNHHQTNPPCNRSRRREQGRRPCRRCTSTAQMSLCLQIRGHKSSYWSKPRIGSFSPASTLGSRSQSWWRWDPSPGRQRTGSSEWGKDDLTVDYDGLDDCRDGGDSDWMTLKSWKVGVLEG